MTPQQIGAVLGKCAAYDRRTVGETDIHAWTEALDGITYAEALEAVRRHYRADDAWLMPAHIRAIVHGIREDNRRHQKHPVRALPSRFEAGPDAARRAREGAALCRAELGAHVDEAKPADEDNPIRDRALRRARTERRTA